MYLLFDHYNYNLFFQNNLLILEILLDLFENVNHIAFKKVNTLFDELNRFLKNPLFIELGVLKLSAGISI